MTTQADTTTERLWEIHLYFEADEATAEQLMEDAVSAVCGGTGEGDDHVCRRTVGGVMLISEFDEADEEE